MAQRAEGWEIKKFRVREVRTNREKRSNENAGATRQMEGPYRKKSGAAPVQIRNSLWMTCKAKTIAGGFETLYKMEARWKSQRQEGKARKIN